MTIREQTSAGLVVYLQSIKYVKDLETFGRVYYFSKRMRYAIMYVDFSNKTKLIEEISAKKYVKQVTEAHLDELVRKVAANSGRSVEDFEDNFDE